MQNSKSGSRPARQPKLTKDFAESVAIEVLGFLAGDPARLERFFALSGIALANLRAAAVEPQFLAAVLDYLASDEALLVAFAESAGHDPAILAKVREVLSPPAEDSA